MYTLNLKEPVKVQELKEESPSKYSFKKFILERYNDEEKELGDTEKKSAKNHARGVLHELLVGYYLNGNKHMYGHPDAVGDAPYRAHARLKDQVSYDEYDRIRKRAKAAADDIRSKIKGDIKAVSWTSKRGDIERETGIPSTQKEDPSDIVVTTRHENKRLHHGISLKASDTKNDTVANPGLESIYGGKELHDKHRKEIREKYKDIENLSPKEREDDFKSRDDNDPYKKDIKEKNATLLDKMATELQSRLSNMSKEDLVHHIRTHVVPSYPTPMEKLGHLHFRHVTTGKDKFKFETHLPSKDHEHILTDPENITHEKSGAGIVFKHKDKIFARQRIKFTSQSDPLGTVKSNSSLS